MGAQLDKLGARPPLDGDPRYGSAQGRETSNGHRSGGYSASTPSTTRRLHRGGRRRARPTARGPHTATPPRARAATRSLSAADGSPCRVVRRAEHASGCNGADHGQGRRRRGHADATQLVGAQDVAEPEPATGWHGHGHRLEGGPHGISPSRHHRQRVSGRRALSLARAPPSRGGRHSAAASAAVASRLVARAPRTSADVRPGPLDLQSGPSAKTSLNHPFGARGTHARVRSPGAAGGRLGSMTTTSIAGGTR